MQVVEVGESHGECTALAGSSCGRYIAMGTRGGGIVVWDLTQRPPALVRKLVRMACELPNAVLHLQWSADSTELSAVDEAGYVRVWFLRGDYNPDPNPDPSPDPDH